MLIVSFAINLQTTGQIIVSFSENPMIGPSNEVLINLGALDTDLIVTYNQWWRLATPWFLHGGIIHYIVNVASLAILGRMLERAHGTLTVAAIFFVSALCGSVTSALFLQVRLKKRSFFKFNNDAHCFFQGMVHTSPVFTRSHSLTR